MSEIAYFDNAATTFPKPEKVYTFMDQFYREYGVNVGRGQYKLASRANHLIYETRQLLQRLFHCPNKKIVFTHTATEALNIILQGIPLKDQFNIYLSPFEHNAVTRVINYLQNKYKLNIFTLPVDKNNFEYDIEKIKYQFTENAPNLVVISHASNVCGVIAPIDDICKLSKAYNAINLIDMSQTAGLIDINLNSEIFDFAVFSGHKTLYGPLGVAGFIFTGNIKPLPLVYGGTGIDSASQELPETIPERYEVGSPNIMAISGLYASLKWIEEVGITNIFEKEQENHKKLFNILNSFENIRIIGSTDIGKTIGVVSCIFEGYSCDNIGQVLNQQNIAVRTGLHCAPYAHRFLGTYPSGTVRFSVGYFNNENDFIKLREGLEFIRDNS